MIIPNIWKNKIPWFQTTNQVRYVFTEPWCRWQCSESRAIRCRRHLLRLAPWRVTCRPLRRASFWEPRRGNQRNQLLRSSLSTFVPLSISFHQFPDIWMKFQNAISGWSSIFIPIFNILELHHLHPDIAGMRYQKKGLPRSVGVHQVPHGGAPMWTVPRLPQSTSPLPKSP